MNHDVVGLYYHKMVDNDYLSEAGLDFSGFSYQMNSQYGTGVVQRFILGDGLDVSYWEAVSMADLQMANLHSNQEVLEICYCLEGEMTITVPDTSHEYQITQGNVLFYYHKNFVDTFTLNVANYSGFSVHIHHDYLQQLLAPAYSELMSTEWRENMKRIFKTERMFVERASLKMERMAKELKAAMSLKNVEAYFSFQAKVMEFLSYCIQFRYRNAELSLSPSELTTVNKARQYLLEHLCQPPSIEDLARHCNTNSCKLKKDFKRAYHATIYGYIKEKRLEKSKVLLQNTEWSIANIANQIGYANPSKYANAFKLYTGMTPSEYRKMQQQG